MKEKRIVIYDQNKPIGYVVEKEFPLGGTRFHVFYGKDKRLGSAGSLVDAKKMIATHRATAR